MQNTDHKLNPQNSITSSLDSEEVLIQAENVGKKFCRSLKKSLLYGAQDATFDLLGVDRSSAPLRKHEFWANEGISFELRRGECLGLIGRNGAGKTTLLKMLNGLIKPDTGRITMKGRVGAMIALGAGFNPILTGRENVYIAASVLGLSKKEVDHKFDEIVEFSEIGQFIDTPVQAYSSGMQVRLGFAVASSLDPDILLIDEVLAVGDASFRNKCYNRISEIRRKSAVIFVSHNMGHVSRICNTAIVLSKGKNIYFGKTEESIMTYEDLNTDTKENQNSFLNYTLDIKSFSVNILQPTINIGDDLNIEVNMELHKSIINQILRVVLYSETGEIVMLSDNTIKETPLKPLTHNITIKSIMLKKGAYKIGLTVFGPDGDILAWSFKQHEIVLKGNSSVTSTFYQPKSTLNTYQ